jgi:tripartite-type tricarboxylate transporter receptor subunit TctC
MPSGLPLCSSVSSVVDAVLGFGRAALLCASFALLAAGVRAAEPYPSKPVRLVVPFAAGSATDSVARILAHELTWRLGQNVLVENRPGANGQLAAAFVAKSAADGHTLFMTTNTSHSANPHLYRTLTYDPIRDFEPIVRTGTLPFMLVVTAALPVETTPQLIAYAKAHPGTLAYAAANSTSLVGAETINVLAGTDLLRVSYKSSPEAMLDLTAGRLQVMVADFVTAIPHVKAGKLKVLGVTTAKRSSLLPGVPPIGDTLEGFDLTSWNGLFAPAGTPQPVLARMAKETLTLLARPDLRKRLAAIGFEVDPLDREEFARYVRDQVAYWGKLVRAARIEPE